MSNGMFSIPRHLVLVLLLIVLSLSPLYHSSALEESCTESNECSKHDEGMETIDNEPSMVLKTYNVGGKNVTMPTYTTPDVSTFYQEEPGSRMAKNPSFPGFAVKFINLSPSMVTLYWHPGGERKGILFNNIAPFGATGTASFPSHTFYITHHGTDEKLQWFTMTTGEGLYVYDSFSIGHEEVETLNEEQYSHYVALKESLEFGEQYREVTGRDWHSLYPRKMPQHKMWRADHFGQEHWVETKETHFLELPPASELLPIKEVGLERRLDDSEPRLLNAYRQPGQQSLNLTLKVLSCAPRAFEIDDFLSGVEIDHILHLATGIGLHKSLTGVDGRSGDNDQVKTRTSRNTWVNREKSPIVDAIYRRTADLLQINESLFRNRDAQEMPDYPVPYTTTAESLQLVHYTVKQEYTAHHDFSYPPLTDEHQSTRFATVLLYLNEGMRGGETMFPRYINAETSAGLKVVPKRGKAVLFYSYLPDGNLDDFSQHAAMPVTEGEKWLTNLWVWDPAFK